MSHHGGSKRQGDVPPDCVPGAYLCTPRVAVGPSGRRFRHSRDCPIHPLEPVDLRAYAQGRRMERWPRRGRTA